MESANGTLLPFFYTNSRSRATSNFFRPATESIYLPPSLSSIPRIVILSKAKNPSPQARPLHWLTSSGGGLRGDVAAEAEGVGLFAHRGDAEGDVLF